MKIVFVSDIHGSTTGLRQVLDFYDRNDCDLICLGGDILNYGPRNGVPADLDAKAVAEMLNRHSDHIIAVRGNCDSEVDQMLLQFPMMSDYAMVTDGGKRIFLTHGHHFVAEPSATPWLRADVVISGHTHVWGLDRDSDGTVRCNMGSVTFPKQGREKTFAYYCDGTLSIMSLEGKIIKSETI